MAHLQEVNNAGARVQAYHCTSSDLLSETYQAALGVHKANLGAANPSSARLRGYYCGSFGNLSEICQLTVGGDIAALENINDAFAQLQRYDCTTDVFVHEIVPAVSHYAIADLSGGNYSLT